MFNVLLLVNDGSCYVDKKQVQLTQLLYSLLANRIETYAISLTYVYITNAAQINDLSWDAITHQISINVTARTRSFSGAVSSQTQPTHITQGTCGKFNATHATYVTHATQRTQRNVLAHSMTTVAAF